MRVLGRGESKRCAHAVQRAYLYCILHFNPPTAAMHLHCIEFHYYCALCEMSGSRQSDALFIYLSLIICRFYYLFTLIVMRRRAMRMRCDVLVSRTGWVGECCLHVEREIGTNAPNQCKSNYKKRLVCAEDRGCRNIYVGSRGQMHTHMRMR